MQVNKTTAGLWTVTYGRKEAPLDVQEAAFAAHGLSMVSPAQLGFLRETQQKDVTTFNQYSRIDTNVFFDDRNGGRAVVIPNNAIGKLVRIVNILDFENQYMEYVLPEGRRDQVYAKVDEMLKSGIAFIAPNGKTVVPTSEFGNNNLTSRMFSDKSLGIQAQAYGDWLQSQGRSEQSFFFDDKEYATSRSSLDYSEAYANTLRRGPYLTKLEVHGSDVGFCVQRDKWFLPHGGIYSGGAFGVRFEPAESGHAKK